MEKLILKTYSKTFLCDTVTPVSAFLRIRDRYTGTFLLESNDYGHTADNASFLCIQPIARLIKHADAYQCYQYDQIVDEVPAPNTSFSDAIEQFLNSFTFVRKAEGTVNGIFGFTTTQTNPVNPAPATYKGAPIPEWHYSAFKYVISFNHYDNTLSITNNCNEDVTDIEAIQEINRLHYAIIYSNLPTHQFNVKKTNPPPTDVQLAQRIEEYVNLAKAHQATVVALHRTELRYSGDEFNVYRSLRYSNPSPFLYFFEYDDFKLMGSAYESYLKTDNGKATISLLLHVADKHHTDQSLKQLKKAKNERANTMVMEYMRRRLSACGEVSFPVNFLDIEELSTLHLLVATLWVKSQKPSDNFNIIETLRYSPVHYGFSADTATEILNQIETENRGLYGGMLGFINFTGETTHVCIDKAFISRNNRLDYYCETRIDANSDIDDCVQDWKNKQNSPVKIIETAANLL